ncbi:MAG: AAA family ATPase [Merismopedia sp. SIO2A8]|nr:AAA family ATPase [Merismopedia sp. SIO2A8]
MAKTAEERYQSTWGIKADLDECLRQWQGTQTIDEFPLARRDFSDTLQIPQTLYGREQELEQLLTAFERVTSVSQSTSLNTSPDASAQGSSELMLVAGYSGIGKSALVQELYKPITRSRGYFIAGKFEQFQRNIPYSAIAHAFQGWVRQLLTATEDELHQWRDRLLSAVGTNGQVIIDVIPEIEWIIGPQPALSDLGATERQNRFNLVFQSVIQAVSAPEHPLVLFLDDLQWVDAATLKLMELILVDADTQHLLVIGAYRDNEVDRTHPLSVALAHWHQNGATINQISLPPLNTAHVTALIADTLHQAPAQVQSLSQLVMEKTRGNPFFVNEFLQTLHTEHLLNFDHQSLTWIWDICQIEKQGITDNVVDLMVGKIKKLSPSTQKVLQVAACIGTEFTLNQVADVCELDAADSFKALTPALNTGLINPLSGLDEDLLIQEYKFGHDRIQQAAYELLEPRSRQVIHFTIGMSLLHHKTANRVGQDENSFAIVNQLNMGIDLVETSAQRLQLAQLNRDAGRRAKQSMAYDEAIAYFLTGLNLLGTTPWQIHYDLTLSLHHELVATYYAMGEFVPMDEAIEKVLDQGRSLLDKVPVYAIKIQAYLAQALFQEAVQTAINVSNLLGVIVSDQDINDPMAQLDAIDAALGQRSPADLADLPTMDNPQQEAALHILSSANSAAYVGVPASLPAIVSKQVQILIHHGNIALAAFVYAWYGTLLCGAFGRIQAGYDFGQLGLTLLDRYLVTHICPKTVFMVNCMIVHWKQHVRETLAPLLMAYHSGRESGDVEFASWAILVRCEHFFCMGYPLALLETEMQVSAESIQKFKQDSALFHNNIFHQATLNLLGKAPIPSHLYGAIFNDARFEEFKRHH